MTETIIDFGPSLRGMARTDWIEEVAELVEYDGQLTHLGNQHLAAYTEHGKTLIVTFETRQSIEALSPKAQPLGWEMVKSCRWTCLSLISEGDTWFRDPAVYAYFDRLVDDGFFEDFNDVLFFGSGPCGYAAAAYSVACPGARVLSLQPQATLAPRITEWDNRFPEQRKKDFTSRYAYAPDMLEGAAEAFVIYDPKQIEDAMHASLFARPNVTRLRCPRMGASLLVDLLQMGILFDLITTAGLGQLNPARFGKLMRARRNHPAYLRRLLAEVETQERTTLIRALCKNVAGRMNAPRFAQRLDSLQDGLV